MRCQGPASGKLDGGLTEARKTYTFDAWIPVTRPFPNIPFA